MPKPARSDQGVVAEKPPSNAFSPGSFSPEASRNPIRKPPIFAPFYLLCTWFYFG
jgi:hypothetical protein